MNGREKSKKSNKHLSFKWIKKHKKIAVCLAFVLLFLGSFLMINYGRYVKDIVHVYYLRTKNFYFSSDKLTPSGKEYEINPWSGTVNYEISISMSSMLNSIKATNSNIEYIVSCSTDGNVSCYIDDVNVTEGNRTIKTDSHSDNFNVVVVPDSSASLKDGDKVSVTVTAESISPYSEELSATFVLVIGNYGVSYVIEDNTGDIYCDLIVTNTLDSNSVSVTLTIDDLSALVFDMSNSLITTTSTETSTASDGYDYINKLTFTVPKKSSLLVRFYKSDSSKNYSYQMGDTSVSSPISFTLNE